MEKQLGDGYSLLFSKIREGQAEVEIQSSASVVELDEIRALRELVEATTETEQIFITN